tara:strand:- start:202 stop:780 length:579 start_codon:yes stop_codon:yes gene_type:complete
MIDVKREDFEIYRKRLYVYALSLLKSRGSAHTLFSELDAKAKDIVQECYLAFHSSDLNVFVTEAHLYSYLKICLYHKYRVSVCSNRKVAQYSLFKAGNLDYIDTESNSSDDNRNDIFNHPVDSISNSLEENNYIDEFLSSLLPRQKQLVDKLLDGFKPFEIAKELNISRQAISDSIKRIKIKYNKYEADTNN